MTDDLDLRPRLERLANELTRTPWSRHPRPPTAAADADSAARQPVPACSPSPWSPSQSGQEPVCWSAAA